MKTRGSLGANIRRASVAGILARNCAQIDKRLDDYCKIDGIRLVFVCSVDGVERGRSRNALGDVLLWQEISRVGEGNMHAPVLLFDIGKERHVVQ